MKTRVSAPARLHLGDLDPFGWGRFGFAPILAIASPRTIVEAEEAAQLEVFGEDAEEAQRYAQCLTETWDLPGTRVHVIERPPRHSGFGSTTSLALAVGTAVARAHGREPRLLDLVQALRRTSTGGIYPFESGGFVVAGGLPVKRGERVLMRDEPLIPPHLFHSEFPPNWRFVLVRPLTAPVSPDKEAEEAAFGDLRDHPVPADLIHKGYFLLASRMLPALLEQDAHGFGQALTEIQVTVGQIYKPVQKKIFNPASQWLVPFLRKNGALGIGQSSWGPTVYGFVDSPDRARSLANSVSQQAGQNAAVDVVSPDNEGRKITCQ